MLGISRLFGILLFLVSAAGAQEVVLVRADSCLGLMNPRIQGFIHGKDEQGSLEPAAVETLSPGSWRLSKYVTYVVAEQFPVSITFNLSDSYAWSQGGYPNAKPWLDWEEYEDHIISLLQWVYFYFPDNPPEFFDVWNEPDLPYFWSGSYAQLLELYWRCAQVVWSVNPDAKLVGPSIARYNENGTNVERIIPFLEDLDSEYGLRLDAIAWHENESGILGSDRPEDIIDHTNSIRANLLEAFGPGYTPELHVNEYSGRYVHLSPGYNAGYLYYLLEAEIDCAMRAAWTVYSPNDPPYGYWSDCWSGLDGMFNWDGYTPQVIYWVYEFFGRMLDKDRLLTVIPNPTTVAQAVRDDSLETVSVMVGRYHHFDQPSNLTLVVEGWPYDGDSVHVVAKRVPHYDGFFNTSCPITVSMPDGPEDSLVMDVSLTAGTFEVSVEDFEDNDVWLFTLMGDEASFIHPDPIDDHGLYAAPNPFNSSTEVHFTMQNAGPACITIHDMTGRLVRLLTEDDTPAGDQSCIWDGNDNSGMKLPTGVYQLCLTTDTYIGRQRLVLIRD